MFCLRKIEPPVLENPWEAVKWVIHLKSDSASIPFAGKLPGTAVVVFARA
jgi:hypothetical protein